MITFEQAKEIAERYAAERSAINGFSVVILHDYTKEDQQGWTFCYDSESYAIHGHERDALLGNLPFLVDRHTGEVRVIQPQRGGPTAEEIDERIAQHAKRQSDEKKE